MVKRVLAVIPARYGSTRLPGKALKKIGDKTVLQRVWEGVSGASLVDEIVVATDHDEIEKVASGFGARVLRTEESLLNGSERLAAVRQQLGRDSYSTWINVQGDMPFITGAIIDKAIDFHHSSGASFDMSTIVSAIRDEETFKTSSIVKVALGQGNQALYFSRSPIPFSRDGEHFHNLGDAIGFKHYGLYVFSGAALDCYESSRLSPLESIEKLEQLRLLEAGGRIGALVVDAGEFAVDVEIDTAEDLERANEALRR